MRTARVGWGVVLVGGIGLVVSCAGGSGDTGLGGGGTAGAGAGGPLGGGGGAVVSTGASTASSTASSTQASSAASTSTSTSSSTGSTGGSGGSGGISGTGGTGGAGGTGLGGSGGAGGASCGTLMFSDPACQTCADGSCCAEVAACEMGTACYRILNCVAMGNAESTCYNNHPNGQAAYDALTMCLGGSCGAECGYCPGNLLQYSDPTLAACNTCINASCCSPFTQLSDDVTADPTCGSGGACPPTDDLETCEGNPMAAVCTTDPDAAAAAACVASECGTSCPLPICDSGIVVTGPAGCSACLSENCCAEFDAFKCQPPAGNACTTNLADYNSCTTDPTCNNNAVAHAADACSASAGCQTICGF